jgi:hypothetical protein
MMNTTTDCLQGLQLAAEHLTAAADHAEANACGDLTSPWHSLAGQIRLIAGGISPVCDDDPNTPRSLGVQDHLDAALTALDSIPSGSGPPDLVVWAWRIADLRSLVTAWASEP